MDPRCVIHLKELKKGFAFIGRNMQAYQDTNL